MDLVQPLEEEEEEEDGSGFWPRWLLIPEPSLKPLEPLDPLALEIRPTRYTGVMGDLMRGQEVKSVNLSSQFQISTLPRAYSTPMAFTVRLTPKRKLSTPMQYVIVLPPNTGSQIYTIDPGKTAESVAAQSGVTDPALYQEFAESDFDSACYSFLGAFTLVSGVVGFDLAKAKQIAEGLVNTQSNDAAKATLAGLSYDVYVAQASLPAEQRIAKYQAAIDANNANALETEQREQAIYAATTIDQVYAIVYPAQAE